MERIPMTREGFENLRNELVKLKSIERPKVIQAIEEARAHGDLSENAEYEAAKDRQGFIEGRIGELEYKVSAAEIIDLENICKDRAVFGCKVLLENIETGENVQYQLLGPDESNIENGKISVSSPLGQAIIGKRPGEEITVVAPGGKRRYEVVDIL